MSLYQLARITSKQKTLYWVYINIVLAVFAYFFLTHFSNQNAAELSKGLYPLLELALVGGLGLITAPFNKEKPKTWQWVVYLGLPLLTGIAYAIQGYSLYISNSYLTVLALENSAESRLTNTWLIRGAISFIVISWIALLLTQSMSKRGEAQHVSKYFKATWLAALSIYLAIFFLTPYEQGSISLQNNQAPLISLARVTFILTERHLDSYHLTEFNTGDEIYYNKDSDFPLQKNTVYSSALPFERILSTPKKRNIIVIFTEGMSARLIESYGGNFPGLTPNIDSLLARSMRIDNYYNHTAATYRGLQGQMASGYPGTGGAQNGAGWGESDNADKLSRIQYRALPQILHDRGYDTYFFSPHHDSVQLNTMLRSLEFDEVYSFDSLNQRYLQGRATLTAGSLSDRSLFQSLIKKLSERARNRSTEPFFIGLYDIGTHAFLDTTEGGQIYGDGRNKVLNRMHNYDLHLGEFLRYFYSSEYAKDTILIFTADHATYPEPAYVDLVKNSNYKPYFIDKIPFAIYDPGHTMPLSFDADGRTSIDFAPTLLHLLGVQNTPNSFIGQSIFETKRSLPFGVAAIGGTFFITTRDDIAIEPKADNIFRDRFIKYKDYIRAYYTLEKENRIFSGNSRLPTQKQPLKAAIALP